MRYVTTRGQCNRYPAIRTIQEKQGPDGGFFLPEMDTPIPREKLESLLQLPFSSCVAEVLNLFLDTRLTSWDVEFAIGRHPVRLRQLGHRITVAECWHNPAGSFTSLVDSLHMRLRDLPDAPTGEWLWVAVRLSVLCGIFGILRQAGELGIFDVSVTAGDFTGPISAWYGRKWGLPIGNIVCCCNENKLLWDLFSQEQMRTDVACVETSTREVDAAVPAGLERLIYACGGSAEVVRYLDACRLGQPYVPDPEVLAHMKQGMSVSVISDRRIGDTIPGAYKTHGYLLSPYDVLTYCGIMDHRARSGLTGDCLMLSDRSPARDSGTVAAAMGVTTEELKRYY